MPAGMILAIDQGTTNTKAMLVDRQGIPVFRASAPVLLNQSSRGFLEQDPLLLWESVLNTTEECVAYASAAGAAIEAIGISNQRETAVAWNAMTGLPVANAVSWQCGRGADICERLASQSEEFGHWFRPRNGESNLRHRIIVNGIDVHLDRGHFCPCANHCVGHRWDCSVCARRQHPHDRCGHPVGWRVSSSPESCRGRGSPRGGHGNFRGR